MRVAYIYSARWPVFDLSLLGRVSWLFTGGGSMHVGIYLPDCTDAEVARHSADRTLSLEQADGARHVCFDIGHDRRPRFQTTWNKDYFGMDGFYTLYPILCADAAAIHDVCCRVAKAQPYSTVRSRCSAITGGVIPCNAGTSSKLVGEGHCGGLCMRIIAAAKTGSDQALYDDATALRVLGIPQTSFSRPFVPRVLAGYTPRAALEAMLAAPRILGGMTHDFSSVHSVHRANLHRPLLRLKWDPLVTSV